MHKCVKISKRAPHYLVTFYDCFASIFSLGSLQQIQVKGHLKV